MPQLVSYARHANFVALLGFKDRKSFRGDLLNRSIKHLLINILLWKKLKNRL